MRLISGMAVETWGWHGFGVFDKAVSSCLDNVSEEHGLTEDGKTVPPIGAALCSKSTAPQHRKHLIFMPFHQEPRPPVAILNLDRRFDWVLGESLKFSSTRLRGQDHHGNLEF